jgi:hypothetical protein
MTYKLPLNKENRYTVSTNHFVDLSVIYKQYASATDVAICLPGTNEILLKPVGGIKPQGLWYAFGREWLEFLNVENDSNVSPVFELTIDTSNIIRLNTVDDIEEFNDTYGDGRLGDTINWLEVSRKYDGIEIYPFVRDYSALWWYRSFDVSSGCIWNLRRIKQVYRTH